MVCLFKDLLGGFSSYMKTKLPKYCCRLVCVKTAGNTLPKTLNVQEILCWWVRNLRCLSVKIFLCLLLLALLPQISLRFSSNGWVHKYDPLERID